MCCKLISVTEIGKPQNVWCSHCTPGKGCGIYEARPAECRIFQCAWLVETSLGDDWRPERAKFLLTQEPGTGRIFIVCDTTAPGTWRREPYYSTIKSLLTRDPAERKEIIVMTGRKVTLLVRQGEFDLGEWKKGDKLVINYDRDNRLVRVALVQPAHGTLENTGIAI
jgi:hypothetical protein